MNFETAKQGVKELAKLKPSVIFNVIKFQGNYEVLPNERLQVDDESVFEIVYNPFSQEYKEVT